DEPNRAEVLNVLFLYRLSWSESRSVGTGNPHNPVPTPGPRDNHPFFLNPATPGERLFVRMSLAPAAAPTQSSCPPEFWWWNHYSLPIHMSTFLGVAYWRSRSGPRKDSNSGAAD